MDRSSPGSWSITNVISRARTARWSIRFGVLGLEAGNFDSLGKRLRPTVTGDSKKEVMAKVVARKEEFRVGRTGASDRTIRITKAQEEPPTARSESR
jgi:hypothetical protein